jgi:hypothetical protein
VLLQFAQVALVPLGWSDSTYHDQSLGIKFLSNSLVVRTIHSTPGTNVGGSHRLSIHCLERSADVVSGDGHDVVCVFQLKLLYKKKGGRKTPSVPVQELDKYSFSSSTNFLWECLLSNSIPCSLP